MVSCWWWLLYGWEWCSILRTISFFRPIVLWSAFFTEASSLSQTPPSRGLRQDWTAMWFFFRVWDYERHMEDLPSAVWSVVWLFCWYLGIVAYPGAYVEGLPCRRSRVRITFSARFMSSAVIWDPEENFKPTFRRHSPRRFIPTALACLEINLPTKAVTLRALDKLLNRSRWKIFWMLFSFLEKIWDKTTPSFASSKDSSERLLNNSMVVSSLLWSSWVTTAAQLSTRCSRAVLH